MVDVVDLPRPFPKCYWILPGRLLAGEYPGDLNETRAVQKINGLLDCGMNFYVDLTETGELIPYKPALLLLAAQRNIQIGYQRMPVRDLDVPTHQEMVAILDLLDQALDDNRSVYLHCWGGAGRTGTVVGCYLVRHGMQPWLALEKINRLRQVIPIEVRRNSPEMPTQIEMVNSWKEDFQDDRR